jgi:glutamine synthetase
MSDKTLNLIKDSEARWVDLRFTDTKGKEQHVSIPVSEVGDFLLKAKCLMARLLLVGRALTNPT